jgi:hypothetical protein
MSHVQGFEIVLWISLDCGLNQPSEPYIGCPYPCPCPWVLGGHGCDVIIHGWEWVGMGAILLFMGGRRYCASLHPTPNWSQTSRMQEIR